jgi:CDGSH-type Zn-finger protein
LSQNQPFCDGAHAGTKFEPIFFVATKELNFLCLCKKTKDSPYCDKAHKKLEF